MEDLQIRFDNGAEYEEFMGAWSRLVGDAFLEWLAPAPGLRWVDVGCGNGAFTEMLAQRCAPANLHGIDPSAAQLAFARGRPGLANASFEQGEATALPYADRAFDGAIMALVIFFVPDPPKGVAEMARVVKPGGSISAYSWDMLGGGFPYAPLNQEMAAVGLPPLWPTSVEASRMAAMKTLWTDAGLVQIETREIVVRRTFSNFDAFWRIAQTGPRVAPRLSTLPLDQVDLVRDRLRARLAPDADGHIVCSGRANAIKARVPG